MHWGGWQGRRSRWGWPLGTAFEQVPRGRPGTGQLGRQGCGRKWPVARPHQGRPGISGESVVHEVDLLVCPSAPHHQRRGIPGAHLREGGGGADDNNQMQFVPFRCKHVTPHLKSRPRSSDGQGPNGGRLPPDKMIVKIVCLPLCSTFFHLHSRGPGTELRTTHRGAKVGSK